MISEESCDTEDWSNDAENTALITWIHYILQCITIIFHIAFTVFGSSKRSFGEHLGLWFTCIGAGLTCDAVRSSSVVSLCSTSCICSCNCDTITAICGSNTCSSARSSVSQHWPVPWQLRSDTWSRSSGRLAPVNRRPENIWNINQPYMLHGFQIKV